MESEGNCLGRVGVTQLEVEKDGGKTRWRWRWKRPRQKSAKGNREVQRKISLCQKVAVMLPSLPLSASLLPVSVPSVANYR